MVEIYSWIIDGEAPVDALARVLEHLWSEELTRYEASPTPGHLFEHLAAIANWMNSGSDWTPSEYVAACRAFPDAGWQASAMYERPGSDPGPGDDVDASRRYR